jgi:hypothetical protein
VRFSKFWAVATSAVVRFPAFAGRKDRDCINTDVPKKTTMERHSCMNKLLNTAYTAIKVIYSCLIIVGEVLAVAHAICFLATLVSVF